MRIIIGLGNPGEKYKLTRHNVGFMVVDAIAKELDLNWSFNKKFNVEICKSNDLILLKPQTYMNNSGQAVSAVLSYYKILPKKLKFLLQKNSDLSEVVCVIHDDIDIEFGKYKESINSGSAGHNGVQSIIDYLKTKNFKRIRIGIKTEDMKKIPTEKFVLQKFNKDEIKIVNEIIDKIKKHSNIYLRTGDYSN